MDDKTYKRFLSKIDTSTECWLWTEKLNNAGYGYFNLKGKGIGAHRWSYIYHHGPIENNLEIRHKCRNKHCVKPDHLESGTHKENMADRIRDGTSYRGEKHWFSKLTEAQVIEIYNSTKKYRILAEENGISISHVSHIKSNATWGWLKKSNPNIGMDKTIIVNNRIIHLRVIPENMVPTLHEGRRKNAFEFYINPIKKITPNTLKTYRSMLNSMAKAIDVTKCHELVKEHAKVLAYMEKLKSTSHGLFLSAVFYELNQPLYNKQDMVPYYKALHPIKMAQIQKSIANESNPDVKEKLVGIMNSMIERVSKV